MDQLIREEGIAIRAIVPAAGKSRRMGMLKQELPIHGRPMLEVVLDTLRACDRIRRIAVIVPSWWRAMSDSRLLYVVNDDPDAEMIDSIRMGLAAHREEWPFSTGEGLLIQPGDCPVVRVEDVEQCIDSFVIHPRSLVVATSAGKRGHPLIVPAGRIDFIESSRCDAGLRELPRAHPQDVHEVTCSVGVTVDIDTPEDYDRICDGL